MKFSRKSQAKRFVASNECTVWEYNLGTEKTNGAVAEINGRYPLKGWAVNTQCDELVYVIAGAGKLLAPSSTVDLQPGDIALIEAGEKFAWEGHESTVFIPCSPAWKPEQHQLSSS